MLNKVKTLKGYSLDAVDALDSKIGKCKDFFFDDRFWTIRYLVAETGTWLTGRQVRISHCALEGIFKEEQTIDVALTKNQIEDCSYLVTKKTVTCQFEDSFFTPAQKVWNMHLYSTHAVNGNYIHATDGEIGHVDDFIIDDETWEIRYLIVNTSNWWVGKKVLISPQWGDRVSWDDKTVFINLSREAIKQSPEYTDKSLLTRNYEIGLHGHYNRKGYWVNALANNRSSDASTAGLIRC